MNMIHGKFRAALLMGAVASELAFAAGAKAQAPSASNNTWPYATTGKSPVLEVVGDIACQPGATEVGEANKETCTTPSTSKGAYTSASLYQSQEATATQIENMKPDAVALLGDL